MTVNAGDLFITGGGSGPSDEFLVQWGGDMPSIDDPDTPPRHAREPKTLVRGLGAIASEVWHGLQMIGASTADPLSADSIPPLTDVPTLAIKRSV